MTNRLAQGVKITMVMESDSLAIRAAMKTCFDVDYKNPNIEILSEPEFMSFNELGNLF